MRSAQEALLLLLNSRPLPNGTELKPLLVAYEIAIKGIDERAIVKTAERYIRGEVEGDTLRFSPSTAEFAKEARRQHFADEYARRPQIQHQPEPEHSDEHRAMMLKRLAEWGKSLGTHQEH